MIQINTKLNFALVKPLFPSFISLFPKPSLQALLLSYFSFYATLDAAKVCCLHPSTKVEKAGEELTSLKGMFGLPPSIGTYCAPIPF